MSTDRDTIERAARARVGSVLESKWRLDRVIAIGGMAVVYAATHRNGNRVAIKILRSDLAHDEGLKQRFAQEGYVANRVDHPGSVRVLDDGAAEDGHPFLVMDLLQGETLDARCARRQENLPVNEVLVVTEQLLEVLAAAHASGVVHRDLKPENLFLTTDGRLKVLDFGIARLAESTADTTPSAQTRPGSLLGTPAFMAPEQARGRWSEVDARTDIWAVGATMFTLLTGRHVHEAETVNEQLAYAAMTAAKPVSTRVLLPHQVAAIIDRALAFSKDERWQSASEMLDALRQTLSETVTESMRHLPRSSLVSGDAETLALPLISSPVDLSGPALPVSTVSATTAAASRDARRPRRRRTGPLIALLVIGGVIVVTAVALRANRPSSPPQKEASNSAPVVVAASAPVASERVEPALSIPTPAESASKDAGGVAPKRDRAKQPRSGKDDALYERRY